MSSGRPFGADAETGEWSCGSVSLTALAEEFGTPLYVYAADQIVQRVEFFRDAFRSQPHTLCYAVKANSSLALLRLLAQRGCGFDVVSGGELERVRVATSGDAQVLRRVVFSGVGKTAQEMDAALRAGIGVFNVESEQELALLAARAEIFGAPAEFGLRVNPDVFAETHPYISTGLSAHKFGVSIAQARGIYAEAARSPWLKAVSVSVHIGSQIRQAEPFGAALSRVVALIRDLREDGNAIRYADAGGGLGIAYEGDAFDAESEVRGYAAALREALGSVEVHLLLEPGRFLVGQAGALLTRVEYTKQNGDKHFVITDAGMNDLIRPALYQAHHEIVPVRPRRGLARTVDVVGPVCESGDFFARDRQLRPVEAGDLLAILDAGAYGMSLASNYNTRPRPAEVLVEKGSARLVRRRESYTEMFAAETV